MTTLVINHQRGDDTRVSNVEELDRFLDDLRDRQRGGPGVLAIIGIDGRRSPLLQIGINNDTGWVSYGSVDPDVGVISRGADTPGEVLFFFQESHIHEIPRIRRDPFPSGTSRRPRIPHYQRIPTHNGDLAAVRLSSAPDGAWEVGVGKGIVRPMMRASSQWIVHGEKVLDENRHIRLSTAEIELPDGTMFTQYVARMPAAAMTVGLDDRQVLWPWRPLGRSRKRPDGGHAACNTW